MLSTKQAKLALKFIIPLFIAVLSVCVLSKAVPETRFMKSAIENLDKSKLTVLEFSGATMASSLAISALPGDFGTPLANTLADMNTYFMFILIVLFFEQIIIIEGTSISFTYIIPAVCILFMLSVICKKEIIKSFAVRLAILSTALVLAVPCSTHFSNAVGSKYLEYVDETIAETNAGADKINHVMESGGEDQTIFDKLTDAFKTAVQGITDLLTYLNNVVKKCINSIAILIVTTFVIPFLMLLFFKWLLNELFKLNITIRMPHLKKTGSKNSPMIKEAEE